MQVPVIPTLSISALDNSSLIIMEREKELSVHYIFHCTPADYRWGEFGIAFLWLLLSVDVE